MKEQSEMGAVLWSFSALISLLLLSPTEDWAAAHAKGHGEWLLEFRRLYRRSEQSSYGEREYSSDTCSEDEARNDTTLRVLEKEFINRTQSVKFAGPLLIHIVSHEGMECGRGCEQIWLLASRVPVTVIKYCIGVELVT